MRRILLAAVLFTTMSMLPATAHAGSFTITLDQVFSGNVPDSTAPYLIATFRDGTTCDPDCGANTVQVILTASLEDSSEFVTEWDFNMTSVVALTASNVVQSGSFALPSVDQPSNNSEKADGEGLYDLAFFFATSGSGGGALRFNGTDSLSFFLTGAGLTAQTFNALSTPQNDNQGAKGPFHSAAHIQGISPDCSGWVGDSAAHAPGTPSGPCGGTSVPDGGTTLTLLGLALGGIGVVRRFMTA